MLDMYVQQHSAFEKNSDIKFTFYKYRLLTQNNGLRFHKMFFDRSPLICNLGDAGAVG